MIPLTWVLANLALVPLTYRIRHRRGEAKRTLGIIALVLAVSYLFTIGIGVMIGYRTHGTQIRTENVNIRPVDQNTAYLESLRIGNMENTNTVPGYAVLTADGKRIVTAETEPEPVVTHDGGQSPYAVIEITSATLTDTHRLWWGAIPPRMSEQHREITRIAQVHMPAEGTVTSR